jgi:tetratricopeptide (TPR) repeat protein
VPRAGWRVAGKYWYDLGLTIRDLSPGPVSTMQRADEQSTHQTASAPPARPRAHHPRRAAGLILALAMSAALAYLGYDRYQHDRLAGSVRRSFAAHRYDEARPLLKRWIDERPSSAEAQFYLGWLALIDDRPDEAGQAIDRAKTLGLDPDRLNPLTSIYQARAGRINRAEPILKEAFDAGQEPQALVAKELARIYLSTYRLPQAGEAIERWRKMAPDDPLPYMWANEIASRSDREPLVLIRNYRAALERDPNLAKARLGLAEQLSKAGRFDEAEQEYLGYLERYPNDAPALVGLGHNAFQNGDLDGATRDFEAALKVDPRQPEALKQLAQADLRLGRYEQACRRFELLIQIETYDYEIRYSYAQALKLSGHPDRAQAETDLATRLRAEHDEILKLRFKIVKDPKDMASRLKVARWMLEHGHADEGLSWTKEILRADPNHAPTHRALADYYQKLGEAGLANYHRLMASSSSP